MCVELNDRDGNCELSPPGCDVTSSPNHARPDRALDWLHRFGIGCTVWFGVRTGRAGPPIGQCVCVCVLGYKGKWGPSDFGNPATLVRGGSFTCFNL